VPPQPARESRAVVASNGPTWKLCITKFRGRQAPLMTTLPQRARFTPRHEYHHPGLASSQGSDQPNFTGVRLQRQADRPCRLRGEADPERLPWASSSGGAPLAIASSPIVSVSAPRQRCAAPTVLQRRPSGHHANPLLSPPRRYSCRIRPETRKARNSSRLYRRLRSRSEPSGRASTALANVLQTCRAAGANILQTLDRRNHAKPDETTTPIPRTFGAFRLRSPAFADN
jgi:hypothetical protein